MSGSARPAVATTTTTRSSSPPAGSGTRKQAAAINSRPGEWADPFSDPPSRKPAAKQVASAKRSVIDDDDVRPAPRKTAAAAPAPKRGSGSGDWDDPFSDGDRKTTGTRRAAPAETPKPAKAPARGKGKWDDPFTSNDDAHAPAAKKPAHPVHPVVASREPAPKRETKKFAPTPATTHPVAAAAPAKAPAQGRWGILKKSH
jgi:hypothetical protein